MRKCVRSIRFLRGLGAFVLGGVALAGLTVAALDLSGFGHSKVADVQPALMSKTPASAAVLTDEWQARIQSESTWRGNRSTWSPPANGRNKPNQLQGPPPEPSWFITPAPSNPWLDSQRYNDRDSIGPSGQNKLLRGVGGYRTVCVRSCDGYFFPISYGTSESNFSRDQTACTNSCSGAKLFYYKVGSQEPEDMVDLSGQKYSKSKNADLFRTQYVENCKCKPHPWEQEATDRHRIYALEDQRRKGNRAVVAELDSLKSKNRLDNRSNSRRRPTDRRPNSKEEASVERSVRQVVAVQTTSPRSDVSRGQSGDRLAVADAQSAGRQTSPSVVTGAVAAAASAATVQTVTSRATATAPVDVGSNRDALHPAAIEAMPLVPAIEASYPQPGEEPMAAPEPVEAEPLPPVSKSSRSSRGSRQSATRSGGGQGDSRRNDTPARGRSSDWARQVFNP